MIIMRLQLRHLTPAVAFLVLSHCAPFPHPRVFDLERLHTGEIRAGIEENFARLKTLTGKARISYEMPNFVYEGISTVQLRFPDSVLVRMEAMFGFTLGTFFSDSKIFKAYIPFEKRVYIGDVDTMAFPQLFQIDLGYDQLLATFTGIMRLPQSQLEVQGMDDEKLVLRARSESAYFLYWIEPHYKLVSRAVLYDPDDQPLYSFGFSRFKKSRGVVLPQVITVEQPQLRERLTVFFSRRSINVRPRDLDLRLKVPDDVEEVIL